MRLISIAVVLFPISILAAGQATPSAIAANAVAAAAQRSGDQTCAGDQPAVDSTPETALTAGSGDPTPSPEARPNAIRPDSPGLVAKRPSGIHWGSLLSQWWLDVSFEHAERVLMEPKTRAQLSGRFFHDWFSDVSQYNFGQWTDGDKFATSYLGHPLQGAVIEAIFWQNDDWVRFSDQDFHNPAYRKALLQAFAFATIDAVQWKLGPVSEATIGHVGLPAHWWEIPSKCRMYKIPCNTRSGLNDLVTNEVGGTALTIGFQWVDKHFQRPMEGRIRSRALIDTMRIFTNPPQSLANFFRFRTPWYRDNRE